MRSKQKAKGMQVLKITIVLVSLLGLIRYIPIYYSFSEYSEFVKHETKRAVSKSQLKQSLLNEARQYSIPVTESDISIRETDNILRVTVDYKVPLKMLIFDHDLKFHTIASAFMPGR
jgi:hypothetical protein